MTSHSHYTNRANSTGGASKAWLLKLQSKMLGDAYLLQCSTEVIVSTITLFCTRVRLLKKYSVHRVRIQSIITPSLLGMHGPMGHIP